MKSKQNLILLTAGGALLVFALVNFYLNYDSSKPHSHTGMAFDNPNSPSGGLMDQSAGLLNNKSMPPNHDALMQTQLLKEQLQKNPNDLEHWIQLGNLLYDNSDFQGAIEPYEKALALDASNTNVRNDYAVCFFNTGNPEKAVKELEKVTASDPNNISALYNLGVVHAHSGRKDLAAKYWNMVVARQPNSDMGQKAARGLADLRSF